MLLSDLWCDREEALQLVTRKIATDPDLGDDIRLFISDGFTILRGAVDCALIDRYLEEINDPQVKTRLLTSLGDEIVPLPESGLSPPLSKVFDSHAVCETALPLVFAPKLHRFLSLIFDEGVLAFQSVHFEVGSTQAMHQDSAYVVVDRPLNLAAAWIALEDIKEGSGELEFLPGSHRRSNFSYCEGRKHWIQEIDGHDLHDQHLAVLDSLVRKGEVPIQTFLPQKGDVLIWHAELAHGGSKVTRPDVTRRSLVVHYCPASNRPNYFNYLPALRQQKWKAGVGKFVSSLYYDIAAYSKKFELDLSQDCSIISSREVQNAIELIRNSGFFDAQYYIDNNPDVRKSFADPALHYLVYGFAEGRDPGPNFSTEKCFDANPELRSSNINPLLFLIKTGGLDNTSNLLKRVSLCSSSSESVNMLNINFVPASDALNYNRAIYGDVGQPHPAQNPSRFSLFWSWAEHQGLHKPEYLLPQLHFPGEVVPFSWEKALRVRPGTLSEIELLAPWAYQIEFSNDISTRGIREAAEYDYHRYRANLFVGLATALLGTEVQNTTVLDAACHCGPIALEFAMNGFCNVKGIDLRPENVAQARFLAEASGIENCSFEIANARDIRRLRKVDVAFCGGLLYHVTFPMELIKDLFDVCEDFLILDSLAHTEPVSAFHLVTQKDVGYSAEGEFHYEFHPTYRAIIDALQSVGFGESVFEIIGSGWKSVPHYQSGVTRSFVAFKPESKTLKRLRNALIVP